MPRQETAFSELMRRTGIDYDYEEETTKRQARFPRVPPREPPERVKMVPSVTLALKTGVFAGLSRFPSVTLQNAQV